MTPKLVAAVPLVYMTRRLRAGDEFDAASQRDADTLVFVGLAKKKDAAPPSQNPESLESVGAEYERLAGRAPDGRWSLKRLQYELGKFKA